MSPQESGIVPGEGAAFTGGAGFVTGEASGQKPLIGRQAGEETQPDLIKTPDGGTGDITSGRPDPAGQEQIVVTPSPGEAWPGSPARPRRPVSPFTVFGGHRYIAPRTVGGEGGGEQHGDQQRGDGPRPVGEFVVGTAEEARLADEQVAVQAAGDPAEEDATARAAAESAVGTGRARDQDTRKNTIRETFEPVGGDEPVGHVSPGPQTRRSEPGARTEADPIVDAAGEMPLQDEPSEPLPTFNRLHSEPEQPNKRKSSSPQTFIGDDGVIYGVVGEDDVWLTPEEPAGAGVQAEAAGQAAEQARQAADEVTGDGAIIPQPGPAENGLADNEARPPQFVPPAEDGALDEETRPEENVFTGTPDEGLTPPREPGEPGPRENVHPGEPGDLPDDLFTPDLSAGEGAGPGTEELGDGKSGHGEGAVWPDAPDYAAAAGRKEYIGPIPTENGDGAFRGGDMRGGDGPGGPPREGAEGAETSGEGFMPPVFQYNGLEANAWRDAWERVAKPFQDMGYTIADLLQERYRNPLSDAAIKNIKQRAEGFPKDYEELKKKRGFFRDPNYPAITGTALEAAAVSALAARDLPPFLHGVADLAIFATGLLGLVAAAHPDMMHDIWPKGERHIPMAHAAAPVVAGGWTFAELFTYLPTGDPKVLAGLGLVSWGTAMGQYISNHAHVKRGKALERQVERHDRNLPRHIEQVVGDGKKSKGEINDKITDHQREHNILEARFDEVRNMYQGALIMTEEQAAALAATPEGAAFLKDKKIILPETAAFARGRLNGIVLAMEDHNSEIEKLRRMKKRRKIKQPRGPKPITNDAA